MNCGIIGQPLVPTGDPLCPGPKEAQPDSSGWEAPSAELQMCVSEVSARWWWQANRHKPVSLLVQRLSPAKVNISNRHRLWQTVPVGREWVCDSFSLAGFTAPVSRGRRCVPCWPERCWRPRRHSAPAPLCRAHLPRAWTARLYSKVGARCIERSRCWVHSALKVRHKSSMVSIPKEIVRLKNQLYMSIGKEMRQDLRFSWDHWRVQSRGDYFIGGLILMEQVCLCPFSFTFHILVFTWLPIAGQTEWLKSASRAEFWQSTAGAN